MCEEFPQLLKIKQFMEEENRVVYEHMKRCTTSVLVKIMQIQTAKMRFCFRNIGLQRIISLFQVWDMLQENKNSYTAGKNLQFVQPLQKAFWHYPAI